MKNIPLLLGSLLLTFIAVVGVAFLFTRKASEPIKPVDPQVVVGQTPNVQGKADATVTVVEFSDFQCPACAQVRPLLVPVLAMYGQQIKFVYRHYPLVSIHPNAKIAARASEAAGRQGAFFPYHDVLFEKQDEWKEERDPTGKFIQYAKDLKLKGDQFEKDLKDEALDAQITADMTDGNTLGVNATPTFYVNGIQTDPTQLQTAIQSALETK